MNEIDVLMAGLHIEMEMIDCGVLRGGHMWAPRGATTRGVHAWRQKLL